MAGSRLAPVVAVVALVGAGCGARAASEDPPRVRETAATQPRPSEQVVLQIRSGGDFFVPLVARGAELPLFTLYRDGRVVTERARAGENDASVPALVERRLTKEGMDAVLVAARRAGLGGGDREYVYAVPTDMATTAFTLATDGERHVTAAYGLGELDEEPMSETSVPASHREPRRKLVELRSKLLDLERWLPAGAISAPRPYEYAALAVYVQPAEYLFGRGRRLDDARRSARAWPSAEGLWGFGDPVDGMPTIRCGTVEGDALERVVAAANTADGLAAWRSDGALYVLAFRPLLPGEKPCPQ